MYLFPERIFHLILRNRRSQSRNKAALKRREEEGKYENYVRIGFSGTQRQNRKWSVEDKTGEIAEICAPLVFHSTLKQQNIFEKSYDSTGCLEKERERGGGRIGRQMKERRREEKRKKERDRGRQANRHKQRKYKMNTGKVCELRKSFSEEGIGFYTLED